jgi:hypothetical protein
MYGISNPDMRAFKFLISLRIGVMVRLRLWNNLKKYKTVHASSALAFGFKKINYPRDLELDESVLM